ncbi:MAG: tetratricopeptide repeat protein [Bacteroidetes bacterium]|nr:MAG: tetratricopeptide repeat protein [Bacteroidota bacterium]
MKQCFLMCFCILLGLPAWAQGEKPTEKEDNTDYWQLALDKIKATSYGEAVNALDKLLEKRKDNALAYQKRGFAKRKMGNHGGAEADYSSALAYNANLTEAYLGRAQARIKLGNYEQAIEDYSQTLTRQPTHSKAKDILYNRGLSYLKLKKYKEALTDFREVLKIESDNAQAWVNIAFIHYFSGEIRKACSDWLRARDLGNKPAQRNTQKACQCCM